MHVGLDMDVHIGLVMSAKSGGGAMMPSLKSGSENLVKTYNLNHRNQNM